MHINRSEKPGFDFLKTFAISFTPQPVEKRQKKMFLSLYRTIRTNNEESLIKYDNKKYTFQKNKDRQSLFISSLIPVPIKNRLSKNSPSSLPRRRSILKYGRIKVSIQSRKYSPSSSAIDESSPWL